MKHQSKISFSLAGLFLVTILASGCASPAVEQSTTSQESLASAVPTEAVSTPKAETSNEPVGTIQNASSVSIDGRWEGSLSVASSSLKTIVTFQTQDGVLKASLDIPQQNLFGYSLVNVSFDGSHVYFEGFEETGRKAVWDGGLQTDGKISGTFSQGGYTGIFELIPAEQVKASKEPLPYKEEEVSLQNGEIVLGGTLTTPNGEGPFPVVIFISGSGAQNRDEELYGFKIFGIIADQLARNGIASLRYDDRGVGASTGNLSDSTSRDLADDVLAWVNDLKTRREINSQKIGLLGHSEGGMIAPMVATQSTDIAFMVLMAGPCMSGEDLIYKQVELITRASGATDEQVEAALKMQHRIFDGLIRGEDWEGAKALIRQQITDQVNALPDDQKHALGNPDQYIDTVYQQQIATLESKWYRYFLTYNPVTVLEKTTIPVLALFGGLDMQVPAEPNADLMKAALHKAGNKDVTVIVYPKANHLFQEAQTGSPQEYANLKPEFVTGFLDDLTNWIIEKTAAAE